MNRDRVLEAFAAYTSAYDADNPRIALKIDHTYRVADLCERITCGLGLPEHDVDLAWLVGMLHDIGRFEQVRRYDTFNDALSVGHAELGAELLFQQHKLGNPLIRAFVADDTDDALIRTAVARHSDYRLPAELDERTLMFCNIVRDADKLDIIAVNCICPTSDIYGISDDEMRASKLTQACVDLFYQHQCLPRGVRNYPADIKLGHICLAWELVYDVSRRIAAEQGYLSQMLSYRWTRPDTQQAFEQMAAHMRGELGLSN